MRSIDDFWRRALAVAGAITAFGSLTGCGHGPPPGIWRDAGAGDLAAVKADLARKVDVNAVDSEGETALWLAAAGGNLDVVKLLIASGANVDARNKDGVTPLMIGSVGHANLDVVAALIAAGADVNARSTAGDTVLGLGGVGRADSYNSLPKRALIPTLTMLPTLMVRVALHLCRKLPSSTMSLRFRP